MKKTKAMNLIETCDDGLHKTHTKNDNPVMCLQQYDAIILVICWRFRCIYYLLIYEVTNQVLHKNSKKNVSPFGKRIAKYCIRGPLHGEKNESVII